MLSIPSLKFIGLPKIQRISTPKIWVQFIWFGLSLAAAIKEVFIHDINNYKIFKFTFINLIHSHSLYQVQPEFYFDSNHYGPLFAFLIAPFTYLPDSIGCILWVFLNAFILYKAIELMPLEENQKIGILLISAHELMTASFSVQFNPIMTAIILFTFILVYNREEFWAAFFIALGTYIKLYGIVGLAFFVFAKDKRKFIYGLGFWFFSLFFMPVLLSSYSFLLHTYREWANILVFKNQQNIQNGMQDISVMGMVRRLSGNYSISNFTIILPFLLIFGAALFLKKNKNTHSFKLDTLASVLMFTVLFSTGSESPTYIIAFIGLGIWFVNKPNKIQPWTIFLLVFALILSSFSPSDLFPQSINENYVRRYSLKAFPIFLIWMDLVLPYFPLKKWTTGLFWKHENYEVNSQELFWKQL